VGAIPRIHYVPDFLSEAEEAALLCRVAGPGAPWVTLLTRRLQQWGEPVDDGAPAPSPLPPWLRDIADLLVQCGVFAPSVAPNHVLVNEYTPGQGIMPHTDGPRYHGCVAILSLGAAAVMHFQPQLATADIGTKPEGPVASVVLRPRSLLVFAGEAFTGHLHGIRAVAEETVGAVAPVVNLHSAHCRPGDVLPRGTRVSLTIRHVLPLGPRTP